MTTIRSLRRRFGIAAPRVAIQTHVPWYWRWLSILLVIAVVIGLGWLSFDLGRRYAGFDRGEAEREQARMEELNRKLQDENAAVRREIASAERKLHIELSTQGNLSSQIRALSEENSLLKEDLAFFQTLMASGGDPGGITVNRFLIVQSKQRVREFRGHLQFIVDFEEGGKASVITLPAEGEASKAYNLSFKFYQRVEGTFMLSPGAVVKKVQVRVLESGDPTPVSTQTVTLS